MSWFTISNRSASQVRCDPGLLYEVLTDYDNYSEWLPLIARSKLLAREGDLAIAEFETASPPKEKLVIECIHTKNKQVLWRRIEGKAPIAQVNWEIAAGEEGQCRVTVTVERTDPFARRSFLNAEKCLRALQWQLSAFLPELAVPGEEGEKIFQISETSEGMECWIRGKKYQLVAAPEGNHD